MQIPSAFASAAAFSILPWLASANTTRFGLALAISVNERSSLLSYPIISRKWLAYPSQSVIVRRDTPESMAALATAQETRVRSRGSSAFGRM